MYEACPVCKKKVTKDGEYYSCEKCGQNIDKPNKSFLLTCKVSDSTGSLFLRFYGAQAINVMTDTTPTDYMMAKTASRSDDK